MIIQVADLEEAMGLNEFMSSGVSFSGDVEYDQVPAQRLLAPAQRLPVLTMATSSTIRVWTGRARSRRRTAGTSGSLPPCVDSLSKSLQFILK